MNLTLTRMFFRRRADARSAVSKFFSSGRMPCGEVTAGSGEVRRYGKELTIMQASQLLCMDWPSFYIEADETVRLQQPDASAIALIRVTGQDISKIMGQLQANGQVFLINPNGLLFGKHAQVDVTGLVVSALDLPDEAFLEGKRTFGGDSDASVTSQGALIAREGGYVALLGHQVKNQGPITANMGSVALVAGSRVTLEMSNGHLLDATMEQAAYAALAENQGQLKADGGHVLMTASTRETPFNTVLRNEGEIQAHTIGNLVGSIRLLGGEEGITVVNGKLDASAPETGDGGYVETCGAHVKVMDTARISTTAASGQIGQWLVDPADITVAPEGGDITGGSASRPAQRQ